MTRTTVSRTLAVTPRVEEAWQAVDACFGRFRLTAGVEALQAMIAADIEDLWRDASMALRWAAAGMLKAKAGFRQLKAYRQLPALRRALAEQLPHRLDLLGSPARLARPPRSCGCPLVLRDRPDGRVLLRAMSDRGGTMK